MVSNLSNGEIRITENEKTKQNKTKQNKTKQTKQNKQTNKKKKKKGFLVVFIFRFKIIPT